MCGWAIWKYLVSRVEKSQRLRKIARQVAEKLADLPGERLKSATFPGRSDIFVRAQVLRLLASQGLFKCSLFERLLEDVRAAISQTHPSDEKLHPFFLFYCVLALEEVRNPAARLAENIRDLCKHASRFYSSELWKSSEPKSCLDIVDLFDLTNDLQDCLGSLASVARTNLFHEEIGQQLDKIADRLRSLICAMSIEISSNVTSDVDGSLEQIRNYLERCSEHVSDLVSGLVPKVIELSPGEIAEVHFKDGSGKESFERSRDIFAAVAPKMGKEGWYGDALPERLRGEILAQMTYASCDDIARLDIGSLAYSLAAAVLIGALEPSSLEVRKALSIILEHQRGGRWTQVLPIWKTDQGTVKIPLNIEIPNAVLPLISCQLETGLWSSWTEIDEIMGWVRGMRSKASHYQGWCNEQLYARDRVDLYVTSQVVQFLSEYAELRRQLVVRSALESVGLAVVGPDAVSKKWDDLRQMDLEEEPDQQVKNRIMRYFINPCQRQIKPEASSILLYGPPGTSKTSIMEALANKLRWQFLSISPSDFLMTGGEQVEARASLIFEILKRANKLVVLFDEVDELLFDREATDRPEGIFRFMTTSMLPKLQSLWARGEIIFGMATNYRERLDKAITRQGRIDQQWAILPPDFRSRVILIKRFAVENNMPIDYNRARGLALKTFFYSYRELERVVRERTDGEFDPWEIVTPTASPEEYSRRPGSDYEFERLIRSQIVSEVQFAEEQTKIRLRNQFTTLQERALGSRKSDRPLFTEEGTFTGMSEAIAYLAK
jgi:hypothetical protein